MAINVDYPVSILDSKLFHSLKDQEMKLLIKEATLKRFHVGESVVKAGEEGKEFFWISSGSVEVQVPASKAGSAPLTISTLQKGDVFGEMVLLGFSKRAATVVVKSDASIYAWDLQKTLDLFLSHPVIGYRVTRNLGHMLGERLISTNLQLRNSNEALDSAIVKNLISG